MSPASTSRATVRALVGSLVAAVTAVTVQGAGAPVASAQAPSVVVGSAVSALPFDLPAPQVLRGSSRKVFAHYFPPLPVSLDNQPAASDYYARNYLTPDGEKGKHAAYGGHLRDRPSTREPSSSPDWRLEDMKTEVRQAVAGGLDGFTLNVIQLADGSNPQLWQNAVLMMRAATQVDPGFRIMLMPDMSGSLAGKDVAAVAAGMAELASHGSAYRLGDGRLVVSPFKAEAHPASWWTQFIQIMRDRHGLPVALLPTFVEHEKDHLASFAPISYGVSIWGSRNPAHNDPSRTHPTSPRGRAAAVKALGLKWMQPVSIQDERPNQGVFDEAENTTNLRTTWQLARLTDADLVQIPTWNDYTEGTHLAPSVKHGWSYLDISAYYTAWYKTGTPPPVLRDAVYLTHRTQPVGAEPSYPQTRLMTLRGGSPARDTVEALTFLTTPGTVLIQVGSTKHVCAVDAGVDTCTVPLAPGEVRATVLRAGQVVAAVRSPHLVTTGPHVQDLQYVAASSRRTPSAPTAVDAAGAVPVRETVVSTPSEDAYANAGAPAAGYGTTSSLSSRGNVAAASYLRFPATTAPAKSRLVSGLLRLRATADAASGSSDTQMVHLLPGRGWGEQTLTWKNRPAPAATPIAHFTAPAAGRTYDIPLSGEAAAALAAGGDLVVRSAGTDEARFWSREFAEPTARPQLVLTWEPLLDDLRVGPGALLPAPTAAPDTSGATTRARTTPHKGPIGPRRWPARRLLRG